MKLGFAILEDNRNLLDYYCTEINKVLKKRQIEGEVVYTADHAEEFVKTIKSGIANVCMLDINLKSDMNGMHIAREIRKSRLPVEIVFITGHLQYMKSAFQVRAFDYLEKPVTSDDLERCILRLHRDIHAETLVKQKVVCIKSGTTIYHLPVDDILFIDHSNSKTTIHTHERKIETYETLTGVAEKLPRDSFIQCHRAIWVNTRQIYSVDCSKGIITLKSGACCSLGKKYRKGFASYED